MKYVGFFSFCFFLITSPSHVAYCYFYKCATIIALIIKFKRWVGESVVLSLYNPWFDLTGLTMATWITQQRLLLCFPHIFFKWNYLCTQMNTIGVVGGCLCVCARTHVCLGGVICSSQCMYSVHSKVTNAMSRTYWTWLAGTITMRCPYNDRSPIPDLLIYLTVLMSAY